ncbi:hypothetical protein [Pseudomonas asiatica]|uniref:hypothetical protein n=1 Tax=Pseudomonas asiatica TaxID=2219225 RepID=UPI003C6E26B3
MPTENRSSNTEIVSVPAAHDLASKVRETLDRQACPNAWMVTAYEAVVANFPQPAPQPHPEPIAWMVGTAFWWTKEEAERDAAATGLPIIGLGPMTGDVEAARLTKATAFVQRLVDCAGTQPSVATGYLRDILDELKGNTPPTAPVAHNENAAFESWARSRLTPLNLRLDEIGLYHDLIAGTAHDAWQARAALEIKAS